MADMDQEVFEGEIIEMHDEEGNTYLYHQEEIFIVDENKYAVLVPVEDEHEHHHCDCGCEHDEDEVAAIIAKIVVNEDGEEEYVDPTEEEFDAAVAAYDALVEEYEQK